jgi:TonB family protein
MRREKKGARALLCALALAANGAGALAQGQAGARQEASKAALEKAVQEIQITGDQLKIAPRMDVAFAGQGGEYGFTFITSELSFDSKVVKGAPFSADAVTESVQVLGDGNRITHTSTSKLYRDSEGRSRREQSMAAIGGLAAGEELPQTVFINDPVAGANYVLNPQARTVQKAMTFSFVRKPNGETEAGGGNRTFVLKSDDPTKPVISGGALAGKAIKKVPPTYTAEARAAGAQGPVDVQVTVDEQGNVSSARAVSGHPLLQQAAVDAARQWTFSPTQLQGQPVKVGGLITFVFTLSDKGANAVQAQPQRAGEPATAARGVMLRSGAAGGEKPAKYQEAQESLGTQSFDGVQAEGTRTTVTIPAGGVGNERPIQIVSERWYSNELQAVVMTKHSDPRFGETTYRLTNISRAEPDHSLFEVPADFKVIDRGDLERRVMIRTPQPQQ